MQFTEVISKKNKQQQKKSENKKTEEYTRSFMLLARFLSVWILHGKETITDRLKHLFDLLCVMGALQNNQRLRNKALYGN